MAKAKRIRAKKDPRRQPAAVRHEPPVLHPEAARPPEVCGVFRHFELGTYRELFRWFQLSGVRKAAL